MTFQMKDSGERQSFDTGAVRDVQTGKGRFDLVSPIVLRRIAGWGPLGWNGGTENMATHLTEQVVRPLSLHHEGNRGGDYLTWAFAHLLLAAHVDEAARTGQWGSYGPVPVPTPAPLGIRRLAVVYQKGADKYADRNWEKGIPLARFLDSAWRHLFQAINGERDEDHIAQAAWNVGGIMHTEEAIRRGLLPAELDNLPNYLTPMKEAA